MSVKNRGLFQGERQRVIYTQDFFRVQRGKGVGDDLRKIRKDERCLLRHYLNKGMTVHALAALGDKNRPLMDFPGIVGEVPING